MTDQKTGKSTDVQVTDRGPTRQDRVIDLSKKSARNKERSLPSFENLAILPNDAGFFPFEQDGGLEAGYTVRNRVTL